MFEIIVGLEQGVTSEEFDQDAADAPDVAREGPSETEDNLGGSVVPCRDDRGMIFVFESGGSEIDEADLGVEQNTSLGSLTADRGGGRRYLPVVGEGLVFVTAQEDVLRLEIGVDQVEIMKDCLYRSGQS